MRAKGEENSIKGIKQDLHYAARMLAKNPEYTIPAISLLAGYIPAGRAARLDPMKALRHE